ncbi:MAG: hypothetical protein C5B50_02905 [Verrucomicrobia bacterium]|nr:MAG: hypothetical protein C5B50_02905 [Verrucomicrobiota bacterium]
MNTWKVILATMLIFGTGVVTGGLLVEHSVCLRDHRLQHPTSLHPAQPASPGGSRGEFLRRIEGELDLAPDQRERIDQILKESQERTRKFIAPRIREETQKTREQFREVLTAEQRVRFDELLKQQQRPRDQKKGPAQRPPPTGIPSGTNQLPATNP